MMTSSASQDLIFPIMIALSTNDLEKGYSSAMANCSFINKNNNEGDSS